MWAIQTIKNKKTSKILYITLVDENTLESVTTTAKELIYRLKNGNKDFRINNIELTTDRNSLRLINMHNDKSRKQAYNCRIINCDNEECIVHNYCIITNQSYGLLSFIAITYQNKIIAGERQTLVDIANKLSIDNISDLIIYNAVINITNSCEIIMYKNENTFKQIQSIPTNIVYTQNNINIKEILGKDIQCKISKITHLGIEIESLGHKGTSNYKIPLRASILSIQSFLGGVNILDMSQCETLKILGEGCFEDLEDLEQVYLSPNLEIIPKNCFKDSLIKNIRFRTGNKVIGESAFEDCTKLTIPIVTNASIIGKKAFNSSGITSLILVNTEDSSISIKEKAFQYCSNLGAIRFPAKTSTDDCLQTIFIRKQAFSNCTRLKYNEKAPLVIPKNVVTIEESAFEGCNNLRAVYIPVTTIYDKRNSFPRKCKITTY